MNFNRHFPFAIGRDFEWLDMRINECPLACPVAANLIASVDVATFRSICPNHLGLHGRENALDLAAIE